MADETLDAETLEPEAPEQPASRDLVETKIGTALPVDAGAPIQGIIPRNPEEAWRLAEAIVLAGMVPTSYESKQADPVKAAKETKAKLMIGIMKGLEIGMAPISALSTIMIVNNRPSVWGDGAKALLYRSGKIEYVKEWMTGEPLTDDWTAHCTIKRTDQTEPTVRSFSVTEAKRAKLWGNTKKPIWYDYPQRMLQARAFSWAARDAASDALFGLSIAEEAQDMAAAPVLTDKSFLDDAPKALEGPEPAGQRDTPETETAAPASKGDPAGLFPDLPEALDPKWQAYVDEAGLEIDGTGADELPAMRAGFASEFDRDEVPEGVRAKVIAKIDAREAAVKPKAKR